MEFTKMNLFKKFKDSMPIGLSSLGLTRKTKLVKKNKNGYPKFFRFDKVSPVAG